MRVLVDLLKEPCFNQLRTQEQLGYIVDAQFVSTAKVIGAAIQVQSSKYSADYLESRINQFLLDVRSKGMFDAEKVENIKKSKIQNLHQVHNNILQEAREYLDSINDDNYQFNSKQRLIEAIEKVTAEDAWAKFEEMFFGNQRRLNIKINSKDHLIAERQAELDQARQANKEFYDKLSMKQSTILNPKLFELSQ